MILVNRMVLCLCALSCFFATAGQNSATRQIIAEEFLSQRPREGKTISGAPVSSLTEPQLGITLWRLKRARSDDPGTRLLVHEGDRTDEWIPERLKADTPLHPNDRIRLSFESPGAGYLYVIDQEEYANNALGDPYLIFPTMRTLHGRNATRPGKVIEIPGQDDRPNYFTVRSEHAGQTGELLSIIISPRPIQGVVAKSQAQRLSPELLREWNKNWGVKATRFELDGAGRPWTKAEQQAGLGNSRLLSPTDPAPQTIFQAAIQGKGASLFSLKLMFLPR